MVSFNKCNEILKTLPIGYYLGHAIDCTLEDGERTYFDPINGRIVVGYKLLPLKEIEETDPELEDNIRCMLYHEVSHAILTPDMYNTDYLNIFEDQRIETLLKTFFHRVDFESFVRKVNEHFEPTIPKSADELYYNIVRFGEGPEEFVKERDELIKKYASLNRRSSRSEAVPYKTKVKEFYEKILDSFEEIKKEMEFEMNGKSESDEESESKSKAKSESETEMPMMGKMSEDAEKEREELDRERIERIVKDSIKNVVEQYSNKKLTSQIKLIIENAQRKKRNRGSAVNGYSGKINPKLINRPGKIENYKWWQKPAVNSESKRYDKIQLNLFCDVSGSFRNSQYKINELIKSLIKIEEMNKDFTFTLVMMGDTNRIAKRNERVVHCNEGNALTNDILDIYKQVQTPNTTIYNLVVFDGDAQSFDNLGSYGCSVARRENKKAWSAWNHPNCIIISDYENETNFDRYSPNATRIYTVNYTTELENNIIKSLGLLFK